MAVSKQQVRSVIAAYKKQGLTDTQIMVAISKDKGEIGKSYNAAIQDGMSSTDFAQSFGLNYKRAPVQVNQPKNPTLSNKVKSVATSAAMGLSDAGAGIVQGGYALTDAAGITKDGLKNYNKQYQRANTETKARQKDAGRTGGDWVRGGTEIAATLPAFMLGGGATKTASLGVKAATQAGIGGVVGAAAYAPDAKARVGNTLGGMIGGAGGEVLGAGAGKVIKKGYNVAKGNLKPNAAAIEKLGKTHNVRTSAGDAGRNSIVKKAEVSTEYMPVVGMSGFREAQHGEAKAAANKVVSKLEDTLSATEFKALPKIQAAAASGDANAQRIMGIVNKADNPDKVLQASLEVRKWREKDIAKKMYDAVQKEVQKLPDDTVTPTHTTTLINSKLDELSKSLAPDEELAKDLKRFNNNINDPARPKDFANMRRLRSELGATIQKYTSGANPNEAAAKYFGDLRRAVEKDITEFAKNSGNPKVKALYGQADVYYKNMVQRQDKAFAKAMQNNKPDEIYNEFIKVGKGDRAKNFYGALDQKGQAALRLKMAEEALSKATNESTDTFSPAKFALEFERLKEPYSQVFKGMDKAEMDGFVKLMRHVERAGQYMENPPNGNRVANMMTNGVGAVAVGLPIYAKGAAVAGVARMLFTTPAGKRLLLAASELPPGAAGLDNILGMIEQLAAGAGANAGIDSKTN